MTASTATAVWTRACTIRTPRTRPFRPALARMMAEPGYRPITRTICNRNIARKSETGQCSKSSQTVAATGETPPRRKGRRLRAMYSPAMGVSFRSSGGTEHGGAKVSVGLPNACRDRSNSPEGLTRPLRRGGPLGLDQHVERPPGLLHVLRPPRQVAEAVAGVA